MRYGFVIPFGDARTCAALAAEAEFCGWDGIFIADCLVIDVPNRPVGPAYHAWSILTAMALQTQQIRIGTMLTAPARRRPWELAQETFTVAQISGGRLIMAIGLGAAQDDAGFYRVGEPMDRRARAQKMDECMQIVAGLWRGERVSLQGAYYQVDGLKLLEPNEQQPIPVWVVGAWPKMQSMRRTLRWQGVMPANMQDGNWAPVTTDDVREIHRFVQQERTNTGDFEIVIEGETPGADRAAAAARLAPLIEAGLTWWIETMWRDGVTTDAVRERIRQGPPRPARS